MKRIIVFLFMFFIGSSIAVTRPDLLIMDYLNRPVEDTNRGSKYLNKFAQVIVKITYLNNQASGGTGFLVRAKSGEAVVVTNAHVCEVQSYGKVAARWDNGKYTILDVLEVDPKHDLCVLSKLPGNLEPLEIALNEAQTYQGIFVIGHPLLFPNTFVEGHVRERVNLFLGDRMVEEKEQCEIDENYEIVKGLLNEYIICGHYFDAIGISAEIYPGNSGSPVFNQFGKVVGVVFAGEGRSNTGFYIPLEYLENILAKY